MRCNFDKYFVAYVGTLRNWGLKEWRGRGMRKKEIPRKKIGELLVESGYVTPDQVNHALEVQKTRNERICSILIDLGHLTEEAFFKFLSEMPEVASMNLSNYRLSEDIINLVPAEIALKLEIVPIGKIGNLLTLAMVCPLDRGGVKEVEDATGFRVRPVLCSLQRFFHVWLKQL